MLNLIPFAVLILFIAAALILFGRRRVPFSYVLLAAGFGAFSFAAWPFWPVDAKGEQQALVLSRTGPRGANAYRTAMSDGHITSKELFGLRDAAGRDIDADGLSAPKR